MSTSQVKEYLKEMRDKVKSLIKQEKWQDAHKLCIQILNNDPDNIAFIRLKNRIEKKVQKINVKAIKNDMALLKPLYREKKYEELLENLKELEPYIQFYPPLKKFIIKVQQKYSENVHNKQKHYYEDQVKHIKELIEKKQFQKAIRDAQKLRILKVKEDELKKLIDDLRTKWIDHELAKNKELLSSDKYEDILLKLHKIAKIDHSNAKLKRLIEQFKKKNAKHNIESRKEFLHEGFAKLKQLMKKKKYVTAQKVAREIIDIKPKSRKAHHYLKKAQRKSSKSSEKMIYKQMADSRKKLKSADKVVKI
ncbi:hypothetical protein GF340_03840 [Candidatus Peregrinibacteria bacterium]|nr:hypothetical protein [Candidatus Peregrinibacteria bacterium]